MQNHDEYIGKIMESDPVKLVVSKPSSKESEFRRVEITRKGAGYQAAKYTRTQVFHSNLDAGDVKTLCRELLEQGFLQLNAWSAGREHMIMVSRKGKASYKSVASGTQVKLSETHDRAKNYLIPEGTIVPALIDMGIFTPEGRIVSSMYDKYRQINRFLEIIDDGVKTLGAGPLSIIDFGCGKSYLTFILYYYFTEVRGLEVNVTGLDLKREVIENCSEAARRYGYDRLHFEVGDIKDYQTSGVDIVISLHACDTATDYALYNAIKWGARLIFSVPCCQHELNAQMQQTQPRTLPLYSRYGVIQERMAALSTDAIRANLLEYCGYKTQLMEFVDLSHTPKNLMIRAAKRRSTTEQHRREALGQVEAAIAEFGFDPALYRMLNADGRFDRAV